MAHDHPKPRTVDRPGQAAAAPSQRTLPLTDLLRGVSRSFYLTLRVLPRGVREPVGLAYLLARAADTIADTRLIPPQERLGHLLAFRDQIRGPAAVEEPNRIASSLSEVQSIPDERRLLESLPQALSLLEELPEPDRGLVRSIVTTLTQGMEMDLTGFPPEDSGDLGALKDAGELDRYVYYVAGCVGEFWTAISVAHAPSLSGWDTQRMSDLGVRFGKALQLTNVLRDVPRDLRMGRCYLPDDQLADANLIPRDLLDPANGSKARPVLVADIRTALEHYSAAEQYILAIPRRCVRLRLAALWPVLIGLATLARLARKREWLDPERPSKISRGWVYRMIALSLPCSPSNVLITAWIRRLRTQVENAL